MEFVVCASLVFAGEGFCFFGADGAVCGGGAGVVWVWVCGAGGVVVVFDVGLVVGLVGRCGCGVVVVVVVVVGVAPCKALV